MKTVEERFWEKVRKSDGCWEWIAYTNPDGYGHFRVDGRIVRAHRWAYEHLVGPIPSGLDLDHRCRVRHCVNPAHLEPVTRKENILRGAGRGAQHARQTTCKNGHPLVVAGTRRRCPTCLAEQNRTWAAANREKHQRQQRDWRAANREKIAEYQRTYYEANRENRSAQTRAWKAAHREQYNAQRRARRAAKKKND